MKTQEYHKLVDKYNLLRSKRLSLSKQADEIKAEEDLLRELIRKEALARMDKDGVEQKAGHGLVKLKMKAVAKVGNWDAFQAHILSTGELDLLEKRPMLSAIRARWEAGQSVPGVEQTQEFEVTISKAKE